MEEKRYDSTYSILLDILTAVENGGGGGGTSDYEALTNKPQVNGVELVGNKTLDELSIQNTLVSGTNIKTINGNDILGEGDIQIAGGGVGKTYSEQFNQGVPIYGEIFNNYSPDASYKNVASGRGSTAAGYGTTASGDWSYAIGFRSTASGLGSFSCGMSAAEASGTYSVAFSSGKASGTNSFAQGMAVTAENNSQHTIGRNNVADLNPSFGVDENKPLFVIGNGKNNHNQSDAVRVLGNGKTYISGVGDFNGTNPTETNSLQAVLTGLQNELNGVNAKLTEVIGKEI